MAEEALLSWVQSSVPQDLRPESIGDLQDGKATARILLDV